MKKTLKIALMFILVLCMVLSVGPKTYASYELVNVENLRGVFAFEWNSYIRRPSNTELFHLSNGSEERLAFCIQKLVHTHVGVVYDDPYIVDSNTTISNYSFEPMVSALAGVPGNTVDNYWNNLLNGEVKRSLNIAYVWWRTYYPDDKAAASAVSCFYWAQSLGAAGQYMEDHLDTSIFARPTGPAPSGLTDGYRYFAFKTYAEAEAQRTPFYEGMFDPGMVEATNAKLRELMSYYENFNYDMPVLTCTSTNTILHPGESVTWTDTTGKISNTTEWTMDTTTLPAGVSVVQNGNDVVISATEEYKGSTEFTVTFTRFKNSNNGAVCRMYGNSAGNQILYEGGLPARSVSFNQKATSLKIELNKEGETPSGHAVLNGAEYHVWNDEGTYDETLTIEKESATKYSALTGWMEPGTYHIQETKAPKGYNLNDTIYDKALTDADCDNVIVPQTVTDNIKRYSLNIIKYDNQSSSEKTAAAGAVLVLSLDTEGIVLDNGEAPEPYELEVTLDDYGRATFIDSDYYAKYGDDYTIPYGTYTLREKKISDQDEPKTRFFIQADPVDLTGERDKTVALRILDDEDVEANIKITKYNKVTGEVVKDEGAKFKIWSVEDESWVKLYSYADNSEIDEFETNAEGYLMTPEALPSGEYRVYESQAPNGFYLEEEYRIPEDETQLPLKGKQVRIDLDSLSLPENTEYPENGTYSGQFVVEVEMEDTPLYANLEIEKEGQALVDVVSKAQTVELNGKEVGREDLKEVKYEYRKLKGVTYEIYTAEEIKWSPKGSVRWEANTKVDTVVTNDLGVAQSRKDLSPGKYRIVETVVPEGYLKAGELPEVTLENNDSYVASADFQTQYNNNKQKIGLQFDKVFDDEVFSLTGEDSVKEAVFGIYANETIKGYDDRQLLFKDDLVDLIHVTDNGEKAKSNVYLPAGKYYVKELYTTYPYSLSEVIAQVELTYDNEPEEEFKLVDSDPYLNKSTGATLTFVKLSKSSSEELVLDGEKFDAADLDKITQKVLASIQANDGKYKEDEKIKYVDGATYQLFTNAECKDSDSVYMKENGQYVPAKFVTKNGGMIVVENLPVGHYFFKEVEAPIGYQISDEVFEFSITQGTSYQTILKVAYDDSVIPELLHKTDIYTGENVKDCTFEITDEDGNVLLHSITDKNGVAWIPQDMFEDGKTYYYTEIEAPDVYKEDGKLYVLNTEPHEFVASFDENGKWTTEKVEVENRRPLTDVELIKTDDEGNRVPNCKFELKSKEEGLFYEVGVTDENGIYVFKDVPKGEYIYTELEAPEEYEIDTTPHEIFVEGDKMVIEFVNTGDIPVIILSVVAVVCAAGIVFLVVKKAKSNK